MCDLRPIVLWSHHDAWCIHVDVRFAESIDHAVAAALSRPKANEQHLVLLMVDDLRQHVPAPGQISGCELTLENGILKVVSKIPHGLEYLLQSLVVGDVVGDDVGRAHADSSCSFLASCRHEQSDTKVSGVTERKGTADWIVKCQANPVTKFEIISSFAS